MLILISILVFSNFKPKSQWCWILFLDWFSEISNLNQFSGQIWVGKGEFSAFWKLVHRVSWGCDSKDAEEYLETKIKMNN